MRTTRPPVIVAAALAALASAVAHAGVIAIDPFAGELTDTFDQYSSVMALQSLPVFGGAGDLEVLTPGGAIKVEFASTFLGDPVVPISGMMVGQLGVAQWVFDAPAVRFGGWFENNSGADDAEVSFYDANDRLIEQVTADIPFHAQEWTWNGWESDVPFSRVVVDGNGVSSGFLWYENMQLDLAPVPAPATVAWVVAVALAPGRRRRR